MRCSLYAQKLAFSERALQCPVKIVFYPCTWPTTINSILDSFRKSGFCDIRNTSVGC
jgi:hypothetical protein